MKIILVAAFAAFPIAAQADPCESVRDMWSAMQEHLPGVAEDLQDVAVVGGMYPAVIDHEGARNAFAATVDSSGSALKALADMSDKVHAAVQSSGCELD